MKPGHNLSSIRHECSTEYILEALFRDKMARLELTTYIHPAPSLKHRVMYLRRQILLHSMAFN